VFLRVKDDYKPRPYATTYLPLLLLPLPLLPVPSFCFLPVKSYRTAPKHKIIVLHVSTMKKIIYYVLVSILTIIITKDVSSSWIESRRHSKLPVIGIPPGMSNIERLLNVNFNETIESELRM
jgi:hypothetical protein